MPAASPTRQPVPTATARPTVQFKSPPDVFVERHLFGAQQLLRDALAPGTRARYANGWQCWLDFVAHATQRPQPRDYLPAHLPPPDIMRRLLAFVHFLYEDRALGSSAIKVALSAVRHEFQANALDVAAFSDPLVTSLRRALTRVAPVQPRGKRLPFSLEMVLSFADYATRTGNPQHHMHAVAAQLGFFCLMRASEYLVTDSAARHTLRSKAVQFECDVPGHATPQLIAAHDISSTPFRHIRAVRVSSLSAKNIRPGAGQASWFSVQSGDTSRFCLTRSLYEWACRAQLQDPEDIFLSLPTSHGPRAPLKYPALSAAIRAVAQRFGLDPRRCGTHSFRRGGATSLIAAGASTPLLMQAGRWQSVPVAASYPERTSGSNDQQLQMLLSPSSFSTRDIRMAQCLPHATPAVSRHRSRQRASTP